MIGLAQGVAIGDSETGKPKPASKLAEIKELPNPFVFADGSAVRNSDDWQRRHAEIKGLFADYEYGHMPAKPQKMTIERGAVVAGEKISIRFRPVGHIPSNEDLLDFADHVLINKPLSEEFGKLAYPEEKNGFVWKTLK